MWLPRPIEEVFDFFSRAENLERITPPWLRFRIITPLPVAMREGAIIEYRLRVRGFPLRWKTRIEHWNPPYGFLDVQVKGPYRLWEHTHLFAAADGGTAMTDLVRYALPFGPLGDVLHGVLVSWDLRAIFDYRAELIKSLLFENAR